MAVTVEQVIERVGGDPAIDTDEATRCLALAEQYVDDHVGETVVPDSVLDEAMLRVSTSLFNQAKAPNGVLMTTFDDGGDGSAAALRVSTDPLRSARWVLAPYMAPLGFA